MKRVFAGFLVLFFLAVFFSGTAFGIRAPEKLVFDLTWTGIKAGTATLQTVNDGDAVRIVSTAKSAPWVSLFYTVDDRTVSVLGRHGSSGIALPRNYHLTIREGRHRRDRELSFDQEKRTAVYWDHISGRKKDLKIGRNTFDALSSFYHVRTMNLEVGKPVFVDVLDNEKLWNVEVQVLRKERIRTKLGSFDTVVIKPLMKSEGIFNRKGDMYIWLTDDEKRLPVKMQTKVAVGSITATLTGGEF